MIRTLFIFISVVLGSCARVADNIEYVSVIYDNCTWERFAALRSSDLVDESKNPEQNGLDVLTIRDKDSLQIYRNLQKTIIVDSTAKIVPVVLKMQFGKEFVDIYHTENEVTTDAMIVFHYEDAAKSSDSLFISTICSNQMRYNSFRATADSLCWAAVANQISEFQQQSMDRLWSKIIVQERK